MVAVVDLVAIMIVAATMADVIAIMVIAITATAMVIAAVVVVSASADLWVAPAVQDVAPVVLAAITMAVHLSAAGNNVIARIKSCSRLDDNEVVQSHPDTSLRSDEPQASSIGAFLNACKDVAYAHLF